MSIVQDFLKRPVLSTVISIVILLGGVISLLGLPITLFPDIAPPLVTVSTNYTGANADVVLKSVIAPLEEQINGVEGMTYINSVAGNDGSATINVFFKLGTDADMAAVNVQNRVSRATSKLPTEVTQYGITTEKKQNNTLMMLAIYSENPDYDETFLQNYVRINLQPDFQRINGVGSVSVYGARDYSMRVWLDPDKMTTYNLVPDDIVAVIREQNLEAAPGRLGQNSGQSFEYTIKYSGKYTEPSQYENIVVKALSDGRILRLKDVARLDFGAFDYSVTSFANGCPSVTMAVYQTTGSNAKEIVDQVKIKLEEASKSFPAGIKYVTPFDTNAFLDASIHQVLKTLFEAFLLVFLVVYIFLQNVRSTLIPAISAIVSLVGAFMFLQIFGFSINMLTLFALVLAIGIVVDDAIVVVEAVHAKLESGEHKSTFSATSSAMGEITGAIVSITLVMSAVFLPVTFMTGPAGAFYRQFALTLAVAVIISAVNALTLSPVLCTLLIKHEHKDGEKKRNLLTRFQDSFNAAFDAVTRKYCGVLTIFSRRKWIPVSALIFFILGTGYLMTTTPTGFIPTEDQGVIFADISMPAGTSQERTLEMLKGVAAEADSIEVVDSYMSIAGVSLLSGSNGGSYGLSVIALKPWEERPGHNVGSVIAELNARTAHLKEGQILFFVPPTVSGFGVSDGFEFQLQDRTGGDITRFSEVCNTFMASMMQRPEIMYVTTNFNINFPQYQFTVDVDKCKLVGVAVADVFSALQGYIGGMMASDFNRFTKYYRVMVQSEPDARTTLQSINKIYVRNSSGNMMPISTLVNFKRVYGAQALNRFNLFTSATITGAPKPGFSSGDAITAIREVGADLPSGYAYEFSGMTRDEIESGSQTTMIFVICFIFVYLILAAQYESYILPMSVMLSLAVGLFGVFLFVSLAGLQNNIYVQVAMIMLIGLLAKNGILIVEFAAQRRAHGMSIIQSAIEGAEARLRPILMTSFAFVFGMIPLVFETGAGAAGNVSIGMAAVGGMIVGTVFGVFIIPIMYVIFQSLDEKSKRNKHIELEHNEA